jgi:hypothetical protein
MSGEVAAATAATGIAIVETDTGFAASTSIGVAANELPMPTDATDMALVSYLPDPRNRLSVVVPSRVIERRSTGATSHDALLLVSAIRAANISAEGRIPAIDSKLNWAAHHSDSVEIDAAFAELPADFLRQSPSFVPAASGRLSADGREFAERSRTAPCR